MSNNDSPQMEAARRVAILEKKARRPTSDFPAFDLKSENSPALLTASQNDYAPGNFDVIRLESNAAISITGFSGGIKGRTLWVYNVGGYVITLTNQSASSISTNRILSYLGTSITLNPNYRAELYYDFTTQRWRYNG